MHFPLYVFFEVLSFVLAIVYRKQLKAFRLSVFLLLLADVCITELLGTNATLLGLKSNHIINNCYLIVITPLYLWLFLDILELKKTIRGVYIGLSALIVLFILWNFLFFQGVFTFNTYSLIAFEFVSCLIALMLIVKIFSEDNFEIDIVEHPYFWISGGLLIFSVMAIVLLGLHQYILKNNLNVGGVKIYNFIMPIACIILYSSYSYAFYLCKRLTSR